ncbi:MAG: SurA N-terminal domain-containing protein [Amoebophilaceae bacterium]|jgi:peptidyl-prolyl cis-trans isomerase D|nr:SurA N-terminal domain-containing protein [Amoebophilaceae bacterium]
MAIISTIRKHSGVAVGIIAIGLILFLISGDIIQISAMLTGKNRTEVGTIAGEKITLQAYQTQVEQLRRYFHNHVGAQEAIIGDQAWNQLVTDIVYQKECGYLGLAISEDELVDMVQGDHIHPELQTAFQNSETKRFDKQQLIDYLKRLAQMPEAQQAQWHQFESGLATLRQREKLAQLMKKSTFITTLEAKEQYDMDQTTFHVKCLYVPYYTCSDDATQVTDKMLKAYLSSHKSTYQVEESRSIRYVTFPIIPTQEDVQAFHEELKTVKESFSQAKADRVFAKVNTDGMPSSSYLQLTAQQLPEVLATQKSRLKEGMVIGPVQEGTVYKLYKVVAIDPQATHPYDIAVIEKHLVPGDQTRDHIFKKADYCASTVKNAAQLKTYSTQEALPLYEAQVGKNDVQIGTLSQARELVRWLYNDAAVGQISPVFELGGEYVVAVMTNQASKGVAPLAQVRDEITLKTHNERKARTIMTKLQQLSGTTLEEKMTQYGDGARLLEVKELRFDDDILSSAGMARQAVGTACALQPGAQATVADENGVLVVEVVAKNVAGSVRDVATYQQSLTYLAQIGQPYSTLEALKALAKVTDNRYKFY